MKMKLLSFNTHSLVEERGEEQVSVLADAILAEKFDVIALQEVNQPREGRPISEGSSVKQGNFAAEVLERLGEAGAKYHFSYLPIKLGYEKYDEGLVFLCRAPIIETQSILLSKPRSYIDWKKRMALGIRCEGSDVWFWNLHTSWWEDADEPFSAQWVRLLPTSSTRRPQPAAMRFFRPALIMLGFSRSLGVIDRMMASVWAMAFSSRSMFFIPAPPGSCARRSCMEPMLLSWIS